MKKNNHNFSSYTDHELVLAIQSGDQSAFAALYDRYFAALYRFCYWQTNKSADAEDIVHDVMISMWRSLPSFRFAASFRNYLYAIAKRQIAAWLRQKYQLPSIQYEEFMQEIGDDDSWLDADENKEKKRRTLAQMLQKLPTREQKILTLRYLRGMSQAEVAAKLNLSIANVKVLCHRSLKKLTQMWQKNTVTHK